MEETNIAVEIIKFFAFGAGAAFVYMMLRKPKEEERVAYESSSITTTNEEIRPAHVQSNHQPEEVEITPELIAALTAAIKHHIVTKQG